MNLMRLNLLCVDGESLPWSGAKQSCSPWFRISTSTYFTTRYRLYLINHEKTHNCIRVGTHRAHKHASPLLLSASLLPGQHCPSPSGISQEHECLTTASAVMKPVRHGGNTTLHSTANDDSRETTASESSRKRLTSSERQPPVPATSSKCVGAASPLVVNSVRSRWNNCSSTRRTS